LMFRVVRLVGGPRRLRRFSGSRPLLEMPVAASPADRKRGCKPRGASHLRAEAKPG